LFLYTPAAAGGYVEELLKRPGPTNDEERNKLRERYRWEASAQTRFKGVWASPPTIFLAEPHLQCDRLARK